MNEEKNKKEKKPIPIKQILVIIAILALGFILSAAMFKMDLEEATSIEYTSTVNSQGQYVYTVKEEQSGYLKEVTTTEIAEDLEPTLGEYIRQSEEENIEAIKYLIEAESVTKLPYIDNIEEGKLNGNIKFYRYLNEIEEEEEKEIKAEDVKEENRLKFMLIEEFNAKLEAFKTNPEENRDIYNYFTIDEEGMVLIAYGSEENRSIQTGFDGSLKDRDLSVDIIKSNSGENYTGNNDSGYSAARYEIYTRPIDYLSLVEQYVMPTNLLYSLLIHTGDIEFVTEIAKLAYESELAIGIYDNKSYYEKNETYTYYKMLNLQANTSLEFQNPIVSITDMGSPYIELTYEDIQNPPYNRIPISCESTTNNNGTIKHSTTFTTGSYSYTPDDYNMYITGTDANNKITSLGTKDNGIYKTHYKQTIDAMSTPTIGILVADTWISRWETTYTKVESNVGPTSTGDVEIETSVNIQEYADNNSVLNALGSTFKINVSNQLANHAETLRKDAIQEILDSTPNSTYKVSTNSIYASTERKKSILNSHTVSCADCKSAISACSAELEEKGEKLGDVYNAVTSSTGALRNTIVYTHYTDALNTWKYMQANQKTADREKEFKNQIEQEGTITTTQTLKGTKDYKDIAYNSTTEIRTTRYEKTNTETDRVKEKDGEKFSKIFNSHRFYDSREAIKKRSGQLWDYIRENEDTAKLEDILKYLLNTATKSEMFGEVGDIDEILRALEPKMQKFGMVSGAVSPFGTNMEKEDFVVAAQNYKNTEYYQRNLASIAGEFYDICTQFNVNPGLAFAWACVETGYGKDSSIPNNNLFGMAVYNGENSGARYATKEDSIEDFCQWVLQNSTSNATYIQAEEYASVNPIFEGSPENNIYALFCRYMYLGDTHIANEPDFNNPAGEEYYKANGSNWGSGGRIYLYHMYELGGLYENEYAERCGHANGSDATTLQERADYVHYSVKKRLKIAIDIFGSQVFIGGEGTYQQSSESEIRGYYTSSSGRTYKEWIQATNVGCGSDSIKFSDRNNLGWRCMGAVGCPIYAAAILSGAEGIDITPRIVNENYYNGNECNTLQAICNAYNIPKTAKSVYNKETYISKLQEGYGFATYVTNASGFAYSYHWIVVADIRPTELGSSEGYDVYILSSTTRGLTETRWHPIEKVINNLKASGNYGCYISE